MHKKNRELLDILSSIYGGKVYSGNSKKSAYKWTVYKQEKIINLIENSFHWNQCVSGKNKRVYKIKEFYRLSKLMYLVVNKNK